MTKFDSQKMLTAKWSKKEKDIIYHYPRRCDGHLIHYYLSCKRPKINYLTKETEWEDSLVEELEKRGYDITTLKFSIERKVTKDG